MIYTKGVTVSKEVCIIFSLSTLNPSGNNIVVLSCGSGYWFKGDEDDNKKNSEEGLFVNSLVGLFEFEAIF